MDKHNPKAGATITRAEAKKMTAAHKAKHPDGLHAEYFGREHFERLLALPGAKGIMIHRGINEKGQHVHILDAVDENGNALAAEPTEQGQPCPPFCQGSGGNNL
jgi:hypothetical protein